MITDTEPATISTFAPASSLIGTTVDAIATGSHMNGINGVTIDGAGIQASLGPNASATTATAHLVIAPTAAPGIRTVTFTKPNSANTMATFTVIAPPALLDENNPGSWPNVFRDFRVPQARFQSAGKLDELILQLNEAIAA